MTGLLVLAAVGQLTLSWSTPSPTTATGIIVERSEANNVCVFTPVATLPLVEAWVDAPVTGGQTWCYRVLASDGTLVSQPSNVACGTAADATPPPTTASQTFTRVGTGAATFTVPLEGYACTRLMGGTAALRILQGTTVLAGMTFSNTLSSPTFTLTCALTPSTVTLAIDGVVRLTAPR